MGNVPDATNYYDTERIAQMVNSVIVENDGQPEAEDVDMVLRALPKVIYDWKDLEVAQIDELVAKEPEIKDEKWRALVEGVVALFYHSQLWRTPPAWTSKTVLEEQFVPRAVGHKIGQNTYDWIFKATPVEMREKNVLFSKREMLIL
jgi:hypothetical protein